MGPFRIRHRARGGGGDLHASHRHHHRRRRARAERQPRQRLSPLSQQGGPLRRCHRALAGARLGEAAPTQDEIIQLLGQLHAADLLQSDVTPDVAASLGPAVLCGSLGWVVTGFAVFGGLACFVGFGGDFGGLILIEVFTM